MIVPGPRVHSFEESLALSAQYADAPWWFDVYRQAFPSLASAASVRADGWAQRGGIDRVLTLKSGKTLTVDEKVREKDWPDFLLERWSDRDRKVKGWIQKDLACDFIAYAFAESCTCYLLPFQTLRLAWIKNGREWIDKYQPPILARNRTYTTESIAVPRDVLLAALTNSMTIRWAREAA